MPAFSRTRAKNLLRAALQTNRCVWRALFGPRLQLPAGMFSYPAVGNHCRFSFPKNIVCHRNVRLLQGACTLADPKGKIVLHEGVTICRYTILQSVGGVLTIGAYSLVGDHCNLYAQGNLQIGEGVMIAAGCRIIPSEHTFALPNVPIGAQPCKTSGIAIQDGAWLGTNVVVLDGVTIGAGAVVGAGSVVTKSIPAFAIAIGSPARVHKMRPGHG
jgi:acetyltransferase-like isoleucine patch superfamily enzyme